jgi:hypothetical protein
MQTFVVFLIALSLVLPLDIAAAVAAKLAGF